ncbi:MAG: hypothetical protein AB7W37_06505 [Syntrophobacteraceae bacterium]
MRCEKMRAVISEEQCVRNQETLAAKKEKCKGRTWFGFYSYCENCDLGSEVRARVEARMADEGPKAVERDMHVHFGWPMKKEKTVVDEGMASVNKEEKQVKQTPEGDVALKKEEMKAEDVFDGIDAGRVTKRCSKCGRELPRSEFHKDERAKDKLYGYCKECSKGCSRKRTKALKDRELEEGQMRTGTAPTMEADAIPVERERASLVIEVDFSRAPEVLERLRADAEEELRTVAAQALWVLREWNTAERGDDRWHAARERLEGRSRAVGAEG